MTDQQWQDEATRYRRFMKQVEAYVLWRARAHDIDQTTALKMLNEWTTKAQTLPSIPGPALFGLVKPDAGW